jgi:hypothetical protein
MGRSAKIPDESIVVIDAKTIHEALNKALERRAMMIVGNDLKKAQEFFKHHYRLALPCEKGVELGLFWHEDLDEAQARITEDQAVCVASICLCGLRGSNRRPIMSALREAMLSLGFKITVEGATWQ